MQAIIRPWRLSKVVLSLNESGIRGMTVTDVKGAGVQGGELRRWAAPGLLAGAAWGSIGSGDTAREGPWGQGC